MVVDAGKVLQGIKLKDFSTLPATTFSLTIPKIRNGFLLASQIIGKSPVDI